MARTNWPGSFGHSLIGDDCRAGFVWSERNRELAGKRQVRFIVLRVPADFREPPRIELPNRFVAVGGEAALIVFDCCKASDSRQVIREAMDSHIRHQRQSGMSRPVEIDLGRRDAGGNGEFSGIGIDSGNFAREMHDLLLEARIRHCPLGQAVTAGVARGTRPAFRCFRPLAPAAVPAARFAL
jgi:hypothetical protein